MNDFLRAYGVILITAVVGLLLVLMGLIFDNEGVTMAAMASLGISGGAGIGGHTNLVQVADTPVAVDASVVVAGKKLL